jgi:hypothetical protein
MDRAWLVVVCETCAMDRRPLFVSSLEEPGDFEAEQQQMPATRPCQGRPFGRKDPSTRARGRAHARVVASRLRQRVYLVAGSTAASANDRPVRAAPFRGGKTRDGDRAEDSRLGGSSARLDCRSTSPSATRTHFIQGRALPQAAAAVAHRCGRTIGEEHMAPRSGARADGRVYEPEARSRRVRVPSAHQFVRFARLGGSTPWDTEAHECEREAFVYEMFAQHFLQDSLSTGHMGHRWGSPEVSDFWDPGHITCAHPWPRRLQLPPFARRTEAPPRSRSEKTLSTEPPPRYRLPRQQNGPSAPPSSWNQQRWARSCILRGRLLLRRPGWPIPGRFGADTCVWPAGAEILPVRLKASALIQSRCRGMDCISTAVH